MLSSFGIKNAHSEKYFLLSWCLAAAIITRKWLSDYLAVSYQKYFASLVFYICFILLLKSQFWVSKSKFLAFQVYFEKLWHNFVVGMKKLQKVTCSSIFLATSPPMECPTNITGLWPIPHFFNFSKRSLLLSARLVLKLSWGHEFPHWLT